MPLNVSGNITSSIEHFKLGLELSTQKKKTSVWIRTGKTLTVVPSLLGTKWIKGSFN